MAKIVSVEEEKSLIVVGHEEVEAEDQLEGADERLMVEQGRSPGQTLTLRVTTRPVLLGAVWILALKFLHPEKPLLMEKPTKKFLQR